MKKIIILSMLSLTIAGILKVGTVKVVNNIRVTVPGSTSVNISGNRKARVKAGKGRVETESGNGTISESGENISISGTLQTKTIKLNGGSVHISGVDNNITIKGNASLIKIEGTGNTVYVDSVSRVIISGVDNKVYYKTSPTKSGKPSISTSGVDNSVSKR